MERVGYKEKMLYPCGWCEKAFATDPFNSLISKFWRVLNTK